MLPRPDYSYFGDYLLDMRLREIERDNLIHAILGGIFLIALILLLALSGPVGQIVLAILVLL